MLYPKLKFFLLISIFSFCSMSCSKDNDGLVPQESTTLNQFTNNVDAPDNRNNNENNNPDNNNPSPLTDNDLVVEWMNLFLELERYAGSMRPNASARAIAYINLAAYETAVPSMEGYISNSRLIRGLDIQNNNARNINLEVALNACYADVMSHFLLNVPTNLVGKISALESTLNDELNNNLSQRDFEQSKDWGERVATLIIAFSQTDTEAEQQVLEPQPSSYEPPTGDGYWTFSAEPERALFPYWGKTRTFIVSTEETTSIPPIAYSEDPESAYYKEMVEVYEANNNARAEDGEALWIAEFWSDDVEGITFSPPARQISIANQLIVDKDLAIDESLHLLLKLGFSLNDAAVSTWKYKYEHMVMRPSVFIHEFMDPSYQTNLYRLIPWPNPSFPGYPSGHSTFASAAAGVFINFFGNNVNFTDRSHEGRTEFRGKARTFTSFEEMATENGYSRIPLGVHIKMDCTEGLRLGYEIATGINEHTVKRERS